MENVSSHELLATFERRQEPAIGHSSVQTQKDKRRSFSLLRVRPAGLFTTRDKHEERPGEGKSVCDRGASKT